MEKKVLKTQKRGVSVVQSQGEHVWVCRRTWNFCIT